MWVFHQSTGQLFHDGKYVATGYSGHGAGLNNHTMEAVHGVGVIPCGRWRIGPVYDHPHLGRHIMALTPIGHDAHGRDAFRMHGDNPLMNHTASDGCLIFGLQVRDMVAASNDNDLEVVL